MDLRHRLWPVLAALFALVSVVLAALLARQARPEGSTGAQAAAAAAAASSPVSTVDGLTVVALDVAVQRRSGLLVQPLAAVAPTGLVTSGTVADLQPLVDWSSKATAASAQAAAASAQARTADAELARVRALYRDDQNASLKSLQAAQAADEEARGNVRTSGAALQAVRREGRLQFGEAIVDGSGGRRLPALLDRRHALVRVAMSPGTVPPGLVRVAFGGKPAIEARWVSPAPQVDAQLGTDVQLYETAQPLPANASVAVELPGASPDAAGVLVPLQAVVWLANQSWVYVQRDDTHFARVALLDAREQPRGFFVPAGLRAGTGVVTRGAGLLLSLEQSPKQGRSGCKDPECDD